MLTEENLLLLELMQVAIGNKECLSVTPSFSEWERLFVLCQEQTVAGVTLMALDKLSNIVVKPPTDLLLEWIGLGEQIKQRNMLVNRRCIQICELFAKKGFRCCILKGQGNARMYPNPYSRTSGDIDVWVEGDRDDIKTCVLSICPNSHDGIMHIDFPVFDDVPVEVHYTPRHSIVPKYNKRLLSWMNKLSEEQFSNVVKLTPSGREVVAAPTARFNAVHQMSHMLGHMLAEGIGMRHVMDYYFVLRALHDEKQKDDYIQLFDYFGMLQFAKGIMWVQIKILGLNEEMAIVPPSEKIGKLILKDILDGGNFGRFRQVNSMREKNILLRGVIDTRRLLRLFKVQPSQAIWRLAHKFGNTDSAKKLLFD